jgi:hypothetical protein
MIQQCKKLKKKEVQKMMLFVMPFVIHRKNAKVKKRRQSLTAC